MHFVFLFYRPLVATFISRCFECILMCLIVEKDTSETILWTWSYPTVSVHQREKITNICRLSECNGTQIPIDFVYVQSSKIWTYIQTTSVNSNALQKVSSVCIGYIINIFALLAYAYSSLVVCVYIFHFLCNLLKSLCTVDY